MAAVDVVGDVVERYRSPEHRAAPSFDVTVGICTARAADTIGAAVGSLQGQQGAPPFEVLVVANSSDDATVRAAVEAGRGLPVRVVECPSAGYDANARNAAFVHAAAPDLVFLDADDVAGPGYVAAMHRALRTHPVVTGSWELERLNADAFPDLRGTDRRQRLPLTERGWPYAPAGTLGIRRAVLEEIGGFDRSLGVAANNAWCFAAAQAGAPVADADGAWVSYRLRTDLRSALRQHVAWGRAEVKAVLDGRRRGLPAPARTALLRRLAVLLWSLRLLPRGRYARWQVIALWGSTAGRLSACVRHRVLEL